MISQIHFRDLECHREAEQSLSLLREALTSSKTTEPFIHSVHQLPRKVCESVPTCNKCIVGDVFVFTAAELLDSGNNAQYTVMTFDLNVKLNVGFKQKIADVFINGN